MYISLAGFEVVLSLPGTKIAIPSFGMVAFKTRQSAGYGANQIMQHG